MPSLLESGIEEQKITAYEVNHENEYVGEKEQQSSEVNRAIERNEKLLQQAVTPKHCEFIGIFKDVDDTSHLLINKLKRKS